MFGAGFPGIGGVRRTGRAERFAAETFFLDNGMQVVVAQNHRVPAVTQMVWYKSGPPTIRSANPVWPTSLST